MRYTPRAEPPTGCPPLITTVISQRGICNQFIASAHPGAACQEKAKILDAQICGDIGEPSMGEQIQMSAAQIQDFTQTTRTARDEPGK